MAAFIKQNGTLVPVSITNIIEAPAGLDCDYGTITPTSRIGTINVATTKLRTYFAIFLTQDSADSNIGCALMTSRVNGLYTLNGRWRRTFISAYGSDYGTPTFTDNSISITTGANQELGVGYTYFWIAI